jgi:predicted PurR-regulated permease PerM
LVALLWVVVVAILVAFAFFASSLCIAFLLAGFLALLLDPIPTYLERWHVRRPVSTAILLIAGMLFVGVLVYGTGKMSTIVDDVPEYADRIRDAIKPWSQGIEKVQKSAGAIATTSSAPPRRVQEVYVSDAPTWSSYLIRGVGSVCGALIVAGIVPFLMFFMLVRKSHRYS